MSANENIEFGSTSSGFVPRQLADIQRMMNEDLAEIVDPRTGERPFQNATDDTVLQQIVAEFAEAVSFTENAAFNAFTMRDPLTATGAGMSQLVQLNGITRNEGAATILNERLTGTPGTLIPARTLIGDAESDVVYRVNTNTIIPQAGFIDIPVTSTTKGEYDPEPNTVVNMLTPISGWESATNIDTISPGTVEETDAQLRRRQQQSTNATSYRQIEAIRAAVFNIPGVTFVRAYQNSDLETDARGIPGKSLAMVVVGGDNTEIANAMIFRVPLGIRYFGSTTVPIVDDLNQVTNVQFSRPIEIPIYVRVNMEIVIDDNIQIFPSNGVDLIKQAIVDFAENGHSICEPIGNPGFPPGQDIIGSWLYTPINSVGGAKITSLELSTDGVTYSTDDIEIAWNQHGTFDIGNIQVVFP